MTSSSPRDANSARSLEELSVSAGQRRRVLFVFADGIGLAPPGPDNPLTQVPMPHVRDLLGGPLAIASGGPSVGQPLATAHANGDLTFRALDACLGVPGLPQSATGQTSLFTGVNAQALLGLHVTAHPTEALREVIAERSLLKRAARAGLRVLFANAHSEAFWRMIEKRRRRLGASTLTALAADAPIPDMADLRAGRAVLWDITHEISAGHFDYDLPVVSPQEAGARLARLSADYDLVLYETFLPDLAGHRRLEPEWVLTRLDAFLGAVLAHRAPETTLVLCSDHGNLEDSSTKAHTYNPVPLVAVGPAAAGFRKTKAITDVTPAILSVLGIDNE